MQRQRVTAVEAGIRAADRIASDRSRQQLAEAIERLRERSAALGKAG